MKVIGVISFTILFVMTNVVFANENPKGSITGQVIDRDTKQEVVGAVVEILNTGILIVTDVHGNFLIEGLDPKTYNLKISAPYYVTTYKTDILVTGKQSSKIVIELKVASYETDEVIVSSERYFDKPNELVTDRKSVV